MVQIVLVRPGSTDFDHQGRIQGTLDIPLSDEGRDQAVQAAKALESLGPETIYTSPCQAAVETGDILGEKTGIRVKRIDKLRNLDHGLWQGLCIDEIRCRQAKVFRQWQEQPGTVCPPEGETVGECAGRIETALSKLARRHRDGCIALVVPEPLASMVHSYITGDALGDMWKSGSDCGKWEVVQFGPTDATHRIGKGSGLMLSISAAMTSFF